MNQKAVSVDGGKGSSLPATAFSNLSARRIKDRLAAWVVAMGGGLVLFSVVAILFVILSEVAPLFYAPTVSALKVSDTGVSQPLFAGVDEYGEVAFAINKSGEIKFFTLSGPKRDLTSVNIGSEIISFLPLGLGRFAAFTTDSKVVNINLSFVVEYSDQARVVTPKVVLSDPIVVSTDSRVFAASYPDSGMRIATSQGDSTVFLTQAKETRALMGPPRKQILSHELSVGDNVKITSLAMDERGEMLMVGTHDGHILVFKITNLEQVQKVSFIKATQSSGTAITALGFPLGSRTLLVGDARGSISSWMLARSDESNEIALTHVADFISASKSIIRLAPSTRNKAFLSLDAAGAIKLHYSTTAVTQLNLNSSAAALSSAVFTPKADGIVAITQAGELQRWQLSNSHPEVSFKTLFSRVWYEGYDKPEHVWQSSGGSDDFESKFGLVPLIFGTMKGTLFALFFAVPIAVAAALYTSQFMHKRLKSFVKPAIEFMAALPSVVIGFLAGLWFAPLVETILPGLFLIPFVCVAVVLMVLFALRKMEHLGMFKVGQGSEFIFLIPAIIFALWFSFQLGGWVETAWLGGDYRLWMQSEFGIVYDQRNSIVAGIAIAFCVIPIIFTISEDVLSSVPKHLVAGSLALGATRWQTALMVVLPVGLPGIFSALMVGIGRAVGETMIVLMATGNTPLLDLSPFNGFRALSANIAVELPEAPYGSTLYRILFLTALILFVFTAVLNTVSEIIRLKLRKKFSLL